MSLLAVNIEPLPLQAKLLGTLIGVSMLALGVLFLLKQRRGGVEERGARLRPTLLRASLYVIAVTSACLLLVGVWIDPGPFPRVFIVTWMVIFFFAILLLSLATIDAIVVDRRGARQQRQLADAHQRELQRDLARFHRSGGEKPPD